MRVLLVTTRYPWPAVRGNQLRTLQFLEALAASGHRVALLAPEPRAGQPPPPTELAGALTLYRRGRAQGMARGARSALARGFPLQGLLYSDPDLRRKIRALAPRADVAVLQLVRLAQHLEDFGATPLVVDFIDSLSLNFRRRALFDRRWLRPLIRAEARRLELWERRMLERARGGLVVCARDREAMAERLPPELASRLRVVPVAVSEPAVGLAPVAAGPPMVAITGNLGYFANRDGIAWWLGAVWPELRRRRPDARLLVAGDRPGRRLRRLVEGRGGRLVVAPPDLKSLLAGATVALAPLRAGSGVPVKILEAWEAGVPVVASPWAAAGTAGRAGQELLVAERPGEWVEATLALAGDPERRRELARSAAACLTACYSPRRVADELGGAVSLAACA